MLRWFPSVLLGLLALLGSLAPTPGDAPPAPRWRQPVGLALLDSGRFLLAANRLSGSVSVIDTTRGTADEFEVGQSLTDIVAGPQGVFATDEKANRLVRLDLRDGGVRVRETIDVPLGPIQVRLGEGAAFVTSRWGKSVSAIALAGGMKRAWTRPLAFAPRPLALTPDGKKLIVGDAFGGHIAVLDATTGILESSRSFPGHNLGGFAFSADGKKLLATYSLMDATSEASMYNVHWGNVVVHRLRPFDVANLLRPEAELLANSRGVVIDGLTNGATDPGPIAFDATGRVVLTVGGLDSIMLDALTEGQRQKVRVGRRPSAVVVDAARNRAYVACSLDDTIGVVDLSEDRALPAIRLGATPALTSELRGQQLFHDARLSHNGWLSCHTCHSDGHTNNKLADTFADGSHGTPKRTLTLLGVAETGPWNWRGQSERLEDVVDRSLRTTMYPDEITREDVRDLSAYLRTLAAPPKPTASEPERIERGQKVFREQNCMRCHAPPLYTSNRLADVGIHDEKGVKEYNPPSLRGVRLGGPFFHDGRARTLAEVFGVHKHQLRGELTAEQLRDLLAFLESL